MPAVTKWIIQCQHCKFQTERKTDPRPMWCAYCNRSVEVKRHVACRQRLCIVTDWICTKCSKCSQHCRCILLWGEKS